MTSSSLLPGNNLVLAHMDVRFRLESFGDTQNAVVRTRLKFAPFNVGTVGTFRRRWTKQKPKKLVSVEKGFVTASCSRLSRMFSR